LIEIRIDKNKNTKLTYYLLNIIRFLIPSFFYRNKLSTLFRNINNPEYIYDRVNYYNCANNIFPIQDSLLAINQYIKKEAKKTYYFDLLKYLKYFNPSLKISYLFGDVTHVPETPTIVKSRPINGSNQNSILMKLNEVRHFIFISDNLAFEEKKNLLVWRGKCYRQHRQDFIQKFYNNKYCNVGQTNTKAEINSPWQKEKMQISEQLQYKFILAIEGNDVASNLKWVMSSNSLAFMVKPSYETWFMEGTLIPNYHYVLLKDDYSNLEEKIEYYSNNIEEALSIIKHANDYTKQFQNKQQEDIISLLVLDKYFKKSQQI